MGPVHVVTDSLSGASKVKTQQSKLALACCGCDLLASLIFLSRPQMPRWVGPGILPAPEPQ